MNWYLEALRKYADFSGRSRRMEYWMFALVYIIIYIVLGLVLSLINEKLALGVVVIYVLAMLVPSLAVLVRRLHDTDHSGWWILISFVPLVGSIWLFVLLVIDSTPGDNRFGANPK